MATTCRTQPWRVVRCQSPDVASLDPCMSKRSRTPGADRVVHVSSCRCCSAVFVLGNAFWTSTPFSCVFHWTLRHSTRLIRRLALLLSFVAVPVSFWLDPHRCSSRRSALIGLVGRAEPVSRKHRRLQDHLHDQSSNPGRRNRTCSRSVPHQRLRFVRGWADAAHRQMCPKTALRTVMLFFRSTKPLECFGPPCTSLEAKASQPWPSPNHMMVDCTHESLAPTS